MKKMWIPVMALALLLGAAGYVIAQPMGSGPHEGMTGQGGMMSDDRDKAVMGQPLNREQLEQVAKEHGMTVDQAKQMVEQCHQMMEKAEAEEAHPQ